jgi:A/G-specific adenine glycosylase
VEEPDFDDRQRADIQQAVLAWGRASGRRLPFRETSDPYAVLVAETMAQQTQVSRVQPALDAFLSQFPTVARLAAVPTADVLRAWRGLGYNRRALNLQRAARAIVDQHGGQFPSDLVALQALPGIGPYTARAVAVHAFGHRGAPIDTNVRRVMRRVSGRDLDGRALQAYADRFVPAEAAAWTNALMDIGAGACRPSRVDCVACPLMRWCASAGRRIEPRARVAPRPRSSPAFTTTTRWLRGRILDRLRDAADDGWAAFEEPLGSHAPEDVVAMLAVLATEGLLERHGGDAHLARLPR